MKAFSEVPDGYREIYSVNLQRDKKPAFLINAAAIAVGVAMALIAHLAICPITSLFDMSAGLGEYFLRFLVLAVGSFVYIILHEATHGAAMKLCGTRKIKYGFTGLYAFAGSDDLYDRTGYIFIALAPVVLFGIIFGIISVFLDGGWFWVVFFLQITNISGAAGDAFVTVRFLMMPRDIVIKDSGVGMTVYSKEAL